MFGSQRETGNGEGLSVCLLFFSSLTMHTNRPAFLAHTGANSQIKFTVKKKTSFAAAQLVFLLLLMFKHPQMTIK